jgi:hypothetical protein
MKTMVYFLSILFLLSLSSCSQGTVNTCTPKCDGKQCGDDQCGGTCQPGCGDNETCNAAGQCIPTCTPDCDGKECGPDGCIGVCPPGCGDNETCNTSGQCVSSCTPDCDGKECGPDGCNGTCPPGCAQEESCDADGQCFSPCLDPSSLRLDQFGIKADGSDETSELQSAFNYAKSNGYTAICFPAGEKTIGISDQIYIPANMEIIGNQCTIKLLDMSAIGHWRWTIDTGVGVYIHHLKINGNMNNQPEKENDPDYYFPKLPNDGIALRDNARFEYNEVYNFGGYTVESVKGDNVIIKNNVIHDGWQYAICTAGTASDYSNNAVVTDNQIYRMGQVGIKIQHTSNSRFERNTITMPALYDLFSDPPDGSPSPTGIRLYSLDGPNDHLNISGNAITGTGGNNEIAIESDTSENTDISITNNQISNADTGININFNNGIITGNTITYVSACIADGGIDNTVTGNTCDRIE